MDLFYNSKGLKVTKGQNYNFN